MDNSQLVKLLSNYCDNFSMDIESSDKIIQCDITYMMINIADPTSAIRPFFQTFSLEDCESNSEVFKVLPGIDLPTLFNKLKYLMSYLKVDKVPMIEGMGQWCADIYSKEKNANESQNIKGTIRYQKFDFYNMRQLTSNVPANKPMDNSQLVKLLSNYCDNFSMDIESSDKIRSMIEYIFDNETQSYFYNQIGFYITTVVTPIYALLFSMC